MDELKEELEKKTFESKLKPFEWIGEYFRPTNMNEEDFKKFIKDMNKPVD